MKRLQASVRYSVKRRFDCMSAPCPVHFVKHSSHKQRNKPKHNEGAESDLIFEKATAS